MFTPEALQALEQRAFAQGSDPDTLMEEAGRLMAEAIRQFQPRPGVCLTVFGKGHNGGDALVAGRILREAGWTLICVPAYPSTEWAPLTARKFQRLGAHTICCAESLEGWRPDNSTPCVILDGLLGIGALGPLRPPLRGICKSINALRARSAVRVFALDIPSGLDGASGRADPDAIVADATLSVGFAKTGLVAEGAEHWVGRLVVLPLQALSALVPDADPLEIATPAGLAPFWPRRRANMHKGDCGRVLLYAGAIGTVGAAALAARGALRAGAGLVTLCVPGTIYAMASAQTPPECMVRPVEDAREVLEIKADALGIGPGLGREKPEAVLEVVRDFAGPAVVDADALNLLAAGQLGLLQLLRGARLLTPHPGEMARLAPEWAALSRKEQVERFTARWPVTLLLKGARTLVGSGGTRLSYNSTGNPGMATGGMGDVLTGVCAALLARGLVPHVAGLLGAWLCGRAAEVLLAEGTQSEDSLLASDVANALGAAFDSLRAGCF